MISLNRLHTSKVLLNLYNLSVTVQFTPYSNIRNILISDCIFSNLRKAPSIIVKKNKTCTKQNLEKSFDLSNQLLKNIVWNKPVENNENDKPRTKFNECIKFLRESNIFKKKDSFINQEIDPHLYKMISRYRDQIFDLALLLKCSPDEAFKAILKHHFLLHSNVTRLKTKVDVITGSGISLPDLRKDLWVLSYTVGKLQTRINEIKTLNLQIKCWLLRCKESTLKRTWENQEENKAALVPFKNSREYLCSRLIMNENQLLSFSRRHPPVLAVKTVKLKEVLDFLLSEGFTPVQIYNTPRILCHSINTIKNRLYMLRNRNCEPRTLSLLCKSTKAFEAYIQKLEDP